MSGLTILPALANLIPSAVDVVGVYDEDFNQVFNTARPIKAVVKPDSKLMEQPLETGAVRVDHRIILPIEIELFVIPQGNDIQDTYEKIYQLFLDGTLLKVQTKLKVFSNMMIQAPPYEETAEMFDTAAISLRLKQVEYANTQTTSVPKNKSNTKTVNRGNLQPMDDKSEDNASVLKKGVEAFKGLF